MKDLRTQAIVLSRTNYGEADRILNLLTPEGKLSVLARGVRKEKSRLAGGVEPFSLIDVVVHQGRGNLGILTGAKMLRFYKNILADLPCLELASGFLKTLSRLAEQTDNPEYFAILEQTLSGLDAGLDRQLIKAWFNLNSARASGEQLNLLRDTSGADLSPEETYTWDFAERALRPDPHGLISAREIKFTRFLLSAKLSAAARVEGVADLLPRIYGIIEL